MSKDIEHYKMIYRSWMEKQDALTEAEEQEQKMFIEMRKEFYPDLLDHRGNRHIITARILEKIGLLATGAKTDD